MINDNPTLKYSRAAAVQKVLRDVRDDEYDFLLQGGDKIRTSWMPFQPADFIGMLSEAVAEAEGSTFLEIGSGIGTKSLLARELFGLSTTGIEYDDTLLTVALKNGRGPAWQGDALQYTGEMYTHADIIWMYRPFKDAVLQDQLEQRVYDEMKPGAIIAGGQFENRPVGFWATVLDDWDTGRRGIWKKLA